MKRFLNKYFKRKSPKPQRPMPNWFLVAIVVICFPILLWFSQAAPVGLDVLKILNDGGIEWNLPTIKQFAYLTFVFLLFAAIILPTFILSGACTTILINRMVKVLEKDDRE